MTRWNSLAALLCSTLLFGPTACGQPPQTPRDTSSLGTTHVYAENHLSGVVHLELVTVAIDGHDVGGLTGERLAFQGAQPLHITTKHLAQGSHVLTLHARAAHRSQGDVLVLNETQQFTVSREPVYVTARLSDPPSGNHAALAVEFGIRGGTLEGNDDRMPASCAAMTPESTQICVTEAMLREAIAEHDAPRVVCVDDALTEMRRLHEFSEGASVEASHHEAQVRKEASFRIANLADKAKHCPSSKASSIFVHASAP